MEAESPKLAKLVTLLSAKLMHLKEKMATLTKLSAETKRNLRAVVQRTAYLEYIKEVLQAGSLKAKPVYDRATKAVE